MCILCLESLDVTSISLNDLPLLYEMMGGYKYYKFTMFVFLFESRSWIFKQGSRGLLKSRIDHTPFV